ncbi:MAG: MaoC family dehydratase [Tissierellia bacterium]|nr:MaoC family dehydratase [Tissierellia bacterium]
MKDIGLTFEQIQIGDRASFTKTITETDVVIFAGISGDLNPVHLDAVYAEQSTFKRRIAHGALVNSLISAVLGMKLPGKGTIYLQQNTSFLAPVYIGDTITATLTVKQKTDRKRVIIETTCTNQKNEIVISGEATVLCPK